MLWSQQCSLRCLLEDKKKMAHSVRQKRPENRVYNKLFKLHDLMLKRNVISVCNRGDRASVKLNANVSMLILMFNSSEVGN